MIHHLDEFKEAELEQDGKRFLWRLDNHGCADKVFQAAGVAMPATIQVAAP